MNDRLKPSRLKRLWRSRRGLRAPRVAVVAEDSYQVVTSEAGVTAAPGLAAPPITTSVATLLTRHILRDGEIIQLILKPSLWTVLFATLPAIGVALLVIFSAGLWAPYHIHIAVEAGIMLVACRAAWAVLIWAGRLYLLTDLRIVRISGVFNPQIHDIPLRKVARTRLNRNVRERLWQLGSIEIIPESDQWPWSVWQTIRKPDEVHETVRRAIARAKQGGCYGSRW